ncbi:MAG: hypothetical protein FJX30_00715 [Alphaproteobacteria bacterium]|nr:hypothetical protein [Alphaproteobacteria bacterium]
MIKIFAHRGFVQNNIKQNSIASLKNAFKNGFKAVEFDIWWQENQLFLSHDKPSKSSLFNLPRFGDYFIYNNQIDYWIDFKNIDENNVREVLRLVKNDLDSNKINLEQVYFAPYITNSELAEKIAREFRNFFGKKINFLGVCDHQSQVLKISELLDIEVIDYVSIDYKLITKGNLELIDPKKIFAWTVNDIHIYNDLMVMGVDKFATDNLVI